MSLTPSHFSIPAISLVLYDKRFGLLQEHVNEEATNFIAAVKTVSCDAFLNGIMSSV